MVPRWLPGPKRETFWITLGCLFEVFWSVICIIFYIKCNFFFQDCGEFRLYFWIKDYFIYIVFMCFAVVYPYSVDVVEAAPEDHWSCWDMQTRGHHFCCTCVCSSGEYNSCETFFLQCSSLERASRSLAKTGFNL